MSILNSVKKMLGIHETYTHFDVDIMIHVNTVFVILNQLGVGPSECFEVLDEYVEWEDFSTSVGISMIRSYVYLKVRMLFDPPVGSVKDAIERQIAELEFRMNVEFDNADDTSDVSNHELQWYE